MRVAIVERELVGGECSYWACMPSKTLLRPGEALTDARRAPGARRGGHRDLDVESALAWRDYMVSDYDDSGAVKWAKENGIDDHPRRGPHRRARHDRRSATRPTPPSDIVIATGSDPVIPPIDGLRELEGVWTNREVTGLKADELPRRLLVLGGGPVGVEMAQALRRMGCSVALVEGSEHLLATEPQPLGEALRRGARRPRASSCTSASTRRGRGARATDYVLEFPDGKVLRGDRLLVATGRKPRVRGHRPGERSGSSRASAASRSTRACRAGDGRVGDRRRDRHLAADVRRQVPGPRRGGQHPRPRCRGELRRRAARRVHRSAGGRGRGGGGRGHGHRVTRLRAPHVDLLPRVRGRRAS